MPSSLSIPWDINAAACLQFSILVLRIKPPLIKAKPQPHTRAVQHHPTVSRTDRQFLTDFFRFESQHLAHHENPRRVFRQAGQADFVHPPELLAGEAVLVEQVVIGIFKDFISGYRGAGRTDALMDDVNDLVFEDGEYSGLCSVASPQSDVILLLLGSVFIFPSF